MALRTALVAPMIAWVLVAGAPAVHAAGDAAKGRAKAAYCAACHGMTGVSEFPEIPHLAGQHAPYLIVQMTSFRRAGLGTADPRLGRQRHDATMTHEAARLSDADVENLAAYYASRPCPAGRARAAPMPKVAARCVSCHGEGGRSAAATVPRLAGQHERYLEDQLKAFREFQSADRRRYRRHPIMGREADRFEDREIRALARYFAAQPCR